MKLAFSTIGCPSYTWTDIFAMASDLGFDGIAFAPAAAPFADDRVFQTMRSLRRAGLEISCLSTDNELANEALHDQNVAEVTSYIKLASRTSTPFVRVLARKSPRPGDISDDTFLVSTLRELCAVAEPLGVTLLIETAAEYADSARLAAVIDAVGSPAMGALWDLHHPYRFFGESPATTIANLGERLMYCQVKDSVMNGDVIEYRMMGEGDLPLYEMFDALVASGYDGYMTLEWIARWARDIAVGEAGIVFPQFLHYMHAYLRSGAAEEVPGTEVGELPAVQPAKLEAHKFELQRSLTNDGTYPWPKEHLIDETFPQVLDRICDLYPYQYAFRYTEPDSHYNPEPDETGEYYVRTYPQFRDDVDEFARALVALGVRQGDKVAIWASNVPQWYLTFWAAVKVGAVLVTVNTGYKIHELEYLLKQSDTHTLVMIDEYKGTSYLDIIDELIPQLDGVRPGEWASEKLPFLKNIVTIDGPHQGCYSWGEALAMGSPELQGEVNRRAAAIDKHDVCNMALQRGQQRQGHRRLHGPLHGRAHDDSGADVPLLWHGARHDGLHDARRDDVAHPHLQPAQEPQVHHP